MNGVNRKLLRKFARESNAIEGITSKHAEQVHVDALDEFLQLEVIEVRNLAVFVSTVQPEARLRVKPGMDVRVGDHRPPPGGPEILVALQHLLDYGAHRNDALDIATGDSPYQVHQEYEALHPFTDGNGRSGRALWAWMMLHHNVRPWLHLGFLHAWYYQSLEEGRS